MRQRAQRLASAIGVKRDLPAGVAEAAVSRQRVLEGCAQRRISLAAVLHRSADARSQLGLLAQRRDRGVGDGALVDVLQDATV